MDSESVTHDALPDGLVVADAYGNVVLTNDVAREQLGLDGDGGIGRPLRDVLLLRDRDGTEWWTMHRPYDGLVNRVSFTEQSWILPRGDEVLVTGRLVRAGRGGPVSRVGVVLRSARGRERLDRERSDLVATVAHELRSPLTGVRGFVTTLINRWESFNDEQKKLMLATVNNDAERLGRLITELLDVARLDTGRLPLYPRPVDIGALVGRVIASSRIGTNREFEVAVEDGLPQVQADPDKLVQVITNLVENAVRHGEGMTSVTLDQDSGDGAAGRGRRGRRDPRGDPQTGVHEVLEVRPARRHRSGHVHRQRAGRGAPRHAGDRGRTRRRCPDHRALAARHGALTESGSQRVPATS